LSDLDRLEHAVAQVEQGNLEAFRQIVEATSSKLIRMTARIVGTVVEAEDVVQEAYVKAHRAISEGKFDHRAKVETWLYSIALHSALDARRRHKHKELNEDQAPEAAWEPIAQLEARQALLELDDWLSELPEEQRVVLVLKAVDDLTTKEISEIVQCSEGAVEQRLVRARQALRDKKGVADD
jgi:RNA polymerase sigma-70 factor (ECF subfamily)